MSFKIVLATCCYEKEQLKTGFGFKGNALTCLWQTVVRLESADNLAIGLGVQSVLWSDSSVYASLGEEKGNLAMLALTQYACRLLENAEIDTPVKTIDGMIPELYSYAKKLTESHKLRKTFVLNALVPIDLALWQLWCKENKSLSFDSISTFDGQRQNSLLNIPLITYNTDIASVRELALKGSALMKIKIGSDPNKNNDLDQMLEWDKKRILDIHNAVNEVSTEYTEKGKLLYYLDANGRYDSKDRLMRLIDFADKEGILDRIILLEEPFDEANKSDVHGLPVNIAADESAHSPEDVEERFSLGYNALALKPIAKTLSETIKIAEYACKNGMLCFCADLTVNPVMVSWNQCVAARLNALPGMKVGVVESNGGQNYSQWDKMIGYHPLADSGYICCENGIYRLDREFYAQNGGIFEIPEHYLKITEGKV